MEFNVLTQFDALMEQEWNLLLAQSAVDTPFLRYGYQHTWWQHKGGGEWPQAELRIITAREDGHLVGIAPLFIGERNGEREFHFIGSVEISDYLDFIVQPQNSETFITGIFKLAKEDKARFPAKIRLFNIPDNSPSLQIMRKIGESEDWSVEIEPAYHTPTITLPEDWETYLAGINKKQRHEIRRKLRRASKSEDDVTWYITTEKSMLNQDTIDFFQLMEFDEEKKRFLTEDMRKQMEAIILWAFHAGNLQLSFLTINDEKAAGYLCFDYRNRIWVYNSGFRPEYQYYSPGWVLLSYLIQHAIRTGKTHFDFMRGDETYKYRFGADDSFVMKVHAELTQH
jgi:CelD/BcsL family acetyltransferase involved in cellulose biosynthesis